MSNLYVCNGTSKQGRYYLFVQQESKQRSAFTHNDTKARIGGTSPSLLSLLKCKASLTIYGSTLLYFFCNKKMVTKVYRRHSSDKKVKTKVMKKENLKKKEKYHKRHCQRNFLLSITSVEL